MPARRNVALILNSGNTYHRKIAVGAVSYANAAADWSIYIEDNPLDKLPDFRTWRADGVICSFDNPTIANTIQELKAPLVGIEGNYGWRNERSTIPYFATDNEAIGQLGAEYLIDRGFSHLGFCGVPRKPLTGWSEDRARAFENHALQAGVTCSLFTGKYSSTRKWTELQRELSDWLEMLPKPVGLMTCNDRRARHVLEACHALDLRVPDDVSVLGVDDDEIMCELTIPTLSSIAHNTQEIGYGAASLLQQLMDGEKVKQVRFAIAPKGVATRRSSDTLAIEEADVAAAVRFIQQHAVDGIRVPDVVKAVHVSRSTLETKFKAVMRRTIQNEIQRVQIQRAQQLVATTDLPLKHIATKSGFNSVQYMTTVFRKRTGVTPYEYRRSSHR